MKILHNVHSGERFYSDIHDSTVLAKIDGGRPSLIYYSEFNTKLYTNFLSQLSSFPVPYLVEGLIDSLVVVSLHRAKVRLDQLEVANASEEGDAARVIETWGENYQQVVDEEGLVVEVEL